MSVVGLVLVGGQSRRMGQDKAVLDFGGRPLGSVAVDALFTAGAAAVATVGRFPIDGAASCPDLWPGEGPLAGIVSGLHWVEKECPDASAVIVLACDLPFVDAQAVQHLMVAADALDETHHGALASDGEKAQPLFAYLRSTAFAQITESFKAGCRSPIEAFGGLSLTIAAPVTDGRLTDVDTQEELLQARSQRMSSRDDAPTKSERQGGHS